VVSKLSGRQVNLRIEILSAKYKYSVDERIPADCVMRRCEIVIRGIDSMCSTIERELLG
jgi:hypothetical protein